jgi:hypothetical protein
MFWFILEELVLVYEFVSKYNDTAALAGNHILNLRKIKGSGTVVAVLTTKQYRILHVADSDAIDTMVPDSSVGGGCGTSKQDWNTEFQNNT